MQNKRILALLQGFLLQKIFKFMMTSENFIVYL